MYSIYRTEGIVLGSVPRGEASNYLFIFTKDFGLVEAHAQGVRELKSKLRHSLQDFSYAHVELVEGKYGWRVVNAIHIMNYGDLIFSGKRENFDMLARVGALLKRLLRGEERNEELFKDVSNLFSFAAGGKDFSRNELKNIEAIAVMRVLYHLGYWGESSVPNFYIKSDFNNPELLESVDKIQPRAIQEINKSLAATQL